MADHTITYSHGTSIFSFRHMKPVVRHVPTACMSVNMATEKCK